MSDVTIGNRHQFDLMALSGPERSRAATLVFRVIGMSAKANDPKFAIVQFRFHRRNSSGLSQGGLCGDRCGHQNQQQTNKASGWNHRNILYLSRRLKTQRTGRRKFVNVPAVKLFGTTADPLNEC